MTSGDEWDLIFLTFVLRLRENAGKNLNQKIDDRGLDPGLLREK